MTKDADRFESAGAQQEAGSQCVELRDDFALLDEMLVDSGNQMPLYRPGPYWATKAKNASNEIKRCGITAFRGSSNLIGLGYTDNLQLDVRNAYNHGLRRLVRRLTKTYPLNRVFEAQIRWTETYADRSISYAEEILNLKGRTRDLLNRYRLPYSLLGNCLENAKVGGHSYSTHYLTLLERHDNIASRINFGGARSLFEIGGGFGANVHLTLENHRNIRKILYLDIAPHLYVGTQYLKAFYGTAVRDYRTLNVGGTIEFCADDSLEILCITPWQIENFASPIDIFVNSCSFVEMPGDIVKNYADKFGALPGSRDAAIALSTYDGYDLSSTLDPNELPRFFAPRKFEHFVAETLVDSTRNTLYYVSPGAFAIR